MIATEKLFLRTAQMDQAELFQILLHQEEAIQQDQLSPQKETAALLKCAKRFSYLHPELRRTFTQLQNPHMSHRYSAQQTVLEQIATWLREEGLAPDASPEAQLCLLWRAQQRTRSRLSSVTKDLERHRSQHLAEMAEVRKSLEQIRIFTEHKDVLAQEIQDENDKLREQLRRIITLQDAQISEVAKMLYQQGLTELIHSSPSEQVAYLLVERASLLESTEHPDKPTGDGDPESLLGTEAQASDTSVCQSTHKRAPRHLQSAWKRLLGFHKTSQSRHAFIPAEARPLTGHGSSLQKECSRLERDLEEGSRRLAMAHNEIRRLTDELESAHLTRRAYEPELQSAQEEVVQLRQEVEKLKRYEMAELRKAKELNDRLDLEIRALRTRVRSLDAEKSSLQQTVVSLQVEVERVESVQVEVDHATKVAEVESLQKKTEQLESALQEQQQRLLTAQLQANQANEFVKTQSAELAQSNEISINLQEKLTAQMQHLMETQETVKFLQKEVEQLELSLLQQQQQQQLGTVHVRADHAFDSTKECPDCHQALKTKLLTQNNWETVKKEICETLKCLDKERGKYHNMKEKHKEKLSRAKQKFDDETTWRDERIKSLERELSLCSHSLAKERELVVRITEENEKLLSERRQLLQRLNEEENNKNDSILTASSSKCRVKFLEMENRKLGNKVLHMSKQISILERSLQNMQSQHFAEELQKMSNHLQIFTSLPVHTSRVTSSELADTQGLQDNTRNSHTKQTDVTTHAHCRTSGALWRPAELGYLNLTSTQSVSDYSTPQSALSSSESLPS